MEILETIPIMKDPEWLSICWVGGAVISLLLFVFFFSDAKFNKTSSICCTIGVVAGIIALAAFILGVTGWVKEHDYDEYVVRLTDMSADEFARNYTVTKTFEYSDVIQVRKIKEDQ